jgi:hypothetical protein
MKLNFDTHDILLMVTGDPRKGIWASQLFHKLQRTTVRTAGQLPTEASRHTLELVALATALRAITRNQIGKLLAGMPRTVTKPRVLVATTDTSFADALTAMIRNDATARPLRAGKNFLGLLMQQLERFDVNVRTPELGDMTVVVLNNWARNHILHQRQFEELPKALQPSAFATTF